MGRSWAVEERKEGPCGQSFMTGGPVVSGEVGQAGRAWQPTQDSGVYPHSNGHPLRGLKPGGTETALH